MNRDGNVAEIDAIDNHPSEAKLARIWLLFTTT